MHMKALKTGTMGNWEQRATAGKILASSLNRQLKPFLFSKELLDRGKRHKVDHIRIRHRAKPQKSQDKHARSIIM